MRRCWGIADFAEALRREGYVTSVLGEAHMGLLSFSYFTGCEALKYDVNHPILRSYTHKRTAYIVNAHYITCNLSKRTEIYAVTYHVEDI